MFQFHPDWIRRCQAVLPELSDINPLLKRSARGIEFSGQTARRGARELQSIGETTGAERLQHIFGLLGRARLRTRRRAPTLAKAWLPPLDDQYAADIIDRAFAYIFDNLVGDVRLSAAADLIGMSESAFSKYFKRMSGQTFSDTVRKLRLAQAGKLLRETPISPSAPSTTGSATQTFPTSTGSSEPSTGSLPASSVASASPERPVISDARPAKNY